MSPAETSAHQLPSAARATPTVRPIATGSALLSQRPAASGTWGTSTPQRETPRCRSQRSSIHAPTDASDGPPPHTTRRDGGICGLTGAGALSVVSVAPFASGEDTVNSKPSSPSTSLVVPQPSLQNAFPQGEGRVSRAVR